MFLVAVQLIFLEPTNNWVVWVIVVLVVVSLQLTVPPEVPKLYDVGIDKLSVSFIVVAKSNTTVGFMVSNLIN